MQTVFSSFDKLGIVPLYVDYTYLVPWSVYQRVHVFGESVVSATDAGSFPHAFHGKFTDHWGHTVTSHDGRS
jgi:hypothetical protein